MEPTPRKEHAALLRQAGHDASKKVRSQTVITLSLYRLTFALLASALHLRTFVMADAYLRETI
jgi:hypothetical protein